MRRCRLEMPVLHVVGREPEHLHRRFRRARNSAASNRVIDREPPAKSAAHQGHVRPRPCPASCLATARPASWTRFGAWVGAQMRAAIALHMRDAVHRLERRVRVKRIGIGRVDRARDRRRAFGRASSFRVMMPLSREATSRLFACASESNASGGGSPHSTASAARPLIAAQVFSARTAMPLRARNDRLHAANRARPLRFAIFFGFAPGQGGRSTDA